jgi:DNA-binding response OmpR family regulator
VSDAWIFSTTPTTDLSAGLAELGYTPRHVGDGLVPSGHDGRAVRAPALAAIDGDAELVHRLRGDEALRDVPLLLVAEAERMPSAATATLAHELVVRPFSLAELETRIARATRRAGIVRLGTLVVDLDSHRVRAGGLDVDLTHIEFSLLAFLVSHPNRAFPREALLARVWGYDFFGGTRTVDVHVQRVRAKLGPEHARLIRTVRSVGYLVEAPLLAAA